ncbi:MAG: hypothetical protein ACLFNI_11025 [Natronomonas sp.]
MDLEVVISARCVVPLNDNRAFHVRFAPWHEQEIRKVKPGVGIWVDDAKYIGESVLDFVGGTVFGIERPGFAACYC